ncbi:MAG: hypothetical protein ETSY1_06680 [Candidatus Entotheonella factor]|uniref:Uncharacterized protein n=1 Tax=Entotheonella factor TaxID=1429438 RepID=W4LUH8_ENTF1|nr:MAG: hypothetical protein ETSY1_06680 [Candidatus Entotheonella factor]
MKRIILILVLTLWIGAGFPVGSYGEIQPEPQPEPQLAESKRFPIVTRLEMERAYGFFIGDEIPLTLEIETEQGVVLDLVNLPREGEQHGVFEVRHFLLTSTDQPKARQLYRVNYRLQYFGAAPLTLQFKPLEILYASDQHRDAVTQRYIYKSLFTQPVTIDISRIGPYRPTPALAPKGPLNDARPWRIWIAAVLGSLLVVAAIGGGGREWWLYYQYQRGRMEGLHSAAAQTLERLRREEELRAPSRQPDATAVSALGGIVRDYLNHAWSVSAHTLTPSELAARLEGSTPQVQDVLALLQHCDTLKYQPSTEDHHEEHVLWDEAVTLFEQIDGR